MLLTVVSQPLSRCLRMPYSSILVMVGFAASELAVALGVDSGIRAGSFHDLIFFVFLPILVFEAAFCIDIRLLWQNLLPVLFLATAIMLASALLTGVGVYYGIAHPAGFPWIAALITGALLAATDPVAVVDQLKSLGAPKRLSMLIEGESLFNDATAIVLFSLFVAVALEPSVPAGIPDMAWRFLMVFLGGAGVGLAAGAETTHRQGLASGHRMDRPARFRRAGAGPVPAGRARILVDDTIHRVRRGAVLGIRTGVDGATADPVGIAVHATR
ncbi:MAG: cation:proton antiporter [Gammaproteobacteria bacterium]|nr:cation:proton antiporter [Gammaproteobacteria bacterium]